jgi:hypothetical protein
VNTVDEAKKTDARRMPDDKKLNSLVSAMADSQAKARAESRERAAKAKRKRKVHPAVPIGLLFPMVGILYFNLSRPPSVLPVPPDVSLKETVYVTALALNAEFEETGVYPSDLREIGMDEEGLRYARTTDGYILTAEEDSVYVEYESGDELTPYKAAFESLLPPFEEVR